MRFLVLLFVAFVSFAIATPAAAYPLIVCHAGGRACHPGSLSEATELGESFELRQTVDASIFDDPQPVAVTVVAVADSEILWNGLPLARNGEPAGAGRTGRFVFTVIVPRDRVRAGPNTAIVRLKRPGSIWPVAQPVHLFTVAPFVHPRLDALLWYLPALLTGGALGAAALWFGMTYALDRTERGARLLALAATGAVLQLALETARAFIPYPHAWQLPRVALIAVMGAFVGLMLARYAAWRFEPAIRNRVTLGCAAASLLSLLLAAGFDQKALGAFTVCMVAVVILAARAVMRGASTAAFALAGAGGALAWIFYDGRLFLDRGYYLALGGVFLALAIEQAASIGRRREPATIDQGGPESPQPVTWSLTTGTRIRLEPIDTIAMLTAADDYTEVLFVDGRTGLHTANLAQAVLSGAGRFVRVHRSHAVNRQLVKAWEPRRGGGWSLTLEGGSVVPVGRTFQHSVRLALGLVPPSA